MDYCLNNKDLCLKLIIIYYASLNNKLKLNNDPIPLLINKFTDVQAFLDEKKLTKILYFNFSIFILFFNNLIFILCFYLLRKSFKIITTKFRISSERKRIKEIFIFGFMK